MARDSDLAIGDGGEYAPIAATVDDGVVSGFELAVGAAGD